MKRIGIFGTGGMAREAGDIAHEIGKVPIYIAQTHEETASWLGAEDVIVESELHRLGDISYVIGVGSNSIRKRIASKHGNTLRFVNLIHPSATFGRDQLERINAGQGNIICAGVRFTNCTRIGNHCIFNLNATVSHDGQISDFVYVAPGAHIMGNVRIGRGTWVGAGAVINQGNHDQKISIGEDVVIGSGAVILGDLESNATYVGVPARKLT